MYCSPIKKIRVTTADIDASINGNIDASVRSKLNTSMANKIAAIGALKIADNEPAAAQTNKSFRVWEFKWNNSARLAPKEAPVGTDVPSNPTGPSQPRVKGGVNNELMMFLRCILPPFCEIEYSAMGIP